MNSLPFVLFLILACSLPVKSDDDTPLPTDNPKLVAVYQACDKGDFDTVKKLVEAGEPVEGQMGTGKFTPLIAASYKGRDDIAKYLLDHGAKINTVDFEGSTPLLHACCGGFFDCAQVLIDAGADVSTGSKYGRTPLMYAAKVGADRIVQSLIEHKVKLDANCDQGPAVFWATCNDQLSTVKLLAEAGANLNLGPENGAPTSYTPLGSAAANNDMQLVHYLIEKNADVNGVGGPDGRTPLMAAVDYEKTETIAQLLDHGAKADMKNKDGMTALMLGCVYLKYASVKALLDHGVDPNVTDPRGETALTIAGDIGETELVDQFKSKGALRTDVHIINKGDPPQALSPQHAWALAVAMPYTQRAGFNPKILGGGATVDNRRSMLDHDWGIKDKVSLFKELDELRDDGHRAKFQARGEEMAKLTGDQYTKYLAAYPDDAGRIKAIHDGYLKWKERSGLAWDMCRSANLVNAAYASQYLTEQEAWDRLMAIARQLQGSFHSWQELSDNFLDGREMWLGERDSHFEACTKLLLNSKDGNSPWNQNAWPTNLAGN